MDGWWVCRGMGCVCHMCVLIFKYLHTYNIHYNYYFIFTWSASAAKTHLRSMAMRRATGPSPTWSRRRLLVGLK